jgi:hypothetical protein
MRKPSEFVAQTKHDTDRSVSCCIIDYIIVLSLTEMFNLHTTMLTAGMNAKLL